LWQEEGRGSTIGARSQNSTYAALTAWVGADGGVTSDELEGGGEGRGASAEGEGNGGGGRHGEGRGRRQGEGGGRRQDNSITGEGGGNLTQRRDAASVISKET